MTSQEVVDYMNRYLDGDLDEREQSLLMEHLKNSPDDQELFERLLLLSGELQELPKVIPPFSLVDSILPQLAEIDAQRETEKLADYSISNQVNTEQNAPSNIISLQDGAASRRKSGWLSRRATAWGGAAAVAAAAIIFVLNMSPGAGSNSSQIAELPPADSVQQGKHPADGGAQFRKGDPTTGQRGAAKQTTPSSPADENTASSAVEENTVSPDGNYAYAVKQGVLEMYSGGELKFAHDFQGSITEPTWSADSTSLTVKVETSDGAIAAYKVDPATGKFEPTAS